MKKLLVIGFIACINVTIYATERSKMISHNTCTEEQLSKDLLEAIKHGDNITIDELVALGTTLHDTFSFDFSNSKINDNGFEQIKKVSLARWLNLSNTNTHDDNLASISHLNLFVLNLSGTNITNQGLAHLKKMKNLEQLELSNTTITDDCFETIQHFKNLRLIRLFNTNTTEELKNKIKKHLSWCIVVEDKDKFVFGPTGWSAD